MTPLAYERVFGRTPPPPPWGRDEAFKIERLLDKTPLGGFLYYTTKGFSVELFPKGVLGGTF